MPSESGADLTQLAMEGTAMSVIRRSPGGDLRMRGAALTSEATVAESPATPPLSIIFNAGLPSIWQASWGLVASRYILRSSVRRIWPLTSTSAR